MRWMTLLICCLFPLWGLAQKEESKPLKVTFTDGTSAVVETEMMDWYKYKDGSSLVEAEPKTLQVAYVTNMFKAFSGYPSKAICKEAYGRYGLIFWYSFYDEENTEGGKVGAELSGYAFSLDGSTTILMGRTMNWLARKHLEQPEPSWHESHDPHRTTPLLVDVWMLTMRHDGKTANYLWVDRIRQ